MLETNIARVESFEFSSHVVMYREKEKNSTAVSCLRYRVSLEKSLCIVSDYFPSFTPVLFVRTGLGEAHLLIKVRQRFMFYLSRHIYVGTMIMYNKYCGNEIIEVFRKIFFFKMYLPTFNSTQNMSGHGLTFLSAYLALKNAVESARKWSTIN